MSIKSTNYVSRQLAENIYLENYMDINIYSVLKEINDLSDDELLDIIETDFDNYRIEYDK